ncbi:MAG: hypothetical protein ACR2RV_28875, partial [Verrucomicrobiales bacterium]
REHHGRLIARLVTGARWLSAKVIEVTGFVGVVFAFFVTRLGILNPYQDWIDAGMPLRNPYTPWLLVGFVLGGLGGSLVIGYLTTARSGEELGH